MVVIVWWTLVRPFDFTVEPRATSKRFVRKLANEGASVNVVPMDLRLRPTRLMMKRRHDGPRTSPPPKIRCSYSVWSPR